MRLRRLVFALLFVVGLASPLVLSFGIRHAAPAATELARVTSPELRYDAVILKRLPRWQLKRPSTEVYIVARGRKVGPADSPIMTATRAQGVQTAWRGDRLLEVHYSSARVNGFTAMWPPRTKTIPEVEIRLSPPAGGSSFPPYDVSQTD
jgi:hypothetical protein